MKITILSMFPELIDCLNKSPVVERAVRQKLVELEIVDIKNYAEGSFRHIDDSPYGGSKGMILRYDVLDKALDSVKTETSYSVLLSPKGRVYNQTVAKEFSKLNHLILVCGHYEGTDGRFDESVDELVSLGDFILTGGEAAAVVIADSVIRLLDNVLKNGVTENESHENNLLEHKQYTHPLEYKGKKVPEILLTGDLKKIEDFNHRQAIQETVRYRPDLAEKYMAEQIKKAEKSFIEMFTKSEELSSNLTMYRDEKLPDMYDHNFYLYKDILKDKEIEDRIKANKASNRDFVKFQSNIRLPGELKDRYKFEESCIVTMALYDTDKVKNWKIDENLEIRSIKTDNIYKDIVEMEIKNYGEAYGIDFTQRKMHRYLTKAKNCKNLDFIAAYKNGQLVSYLYTFTSNDCVAIDSLFTSPEYRHKKAATTLLAHACSKAPFAYLHADAEDTPIQMYKVLGFNALYKSWEYVGKFTE